MSKQYLGIDIGGTAVKIGLVDEQGQITAKCEESVSFDNYQTPILDTVCRVATQFAPPSSIDLSGVAVSATGQIDSRLGIVAGTCGSLPGWSGSKIQAALQDIYHKPVTVANDANCMCLGETWVGGAAGRKDVIGLTIGTGIGAGVITNGHLLEGVRGLGGEIGHMRTHAIKGRQCTCGAVGCWERYASTSALVRDAQKINQRYCNGRIIFEELRLGNTELQPLLNSWINEIAQGIASLVHIFNPEIILIGGGVSQQQELLIKPIEKHILDGVMPAFASGLSVQAAALKNDAGLIGAVAYFLNH